MRRIGRKADVQPPQAMVDIVFLLLIFFLVAGTVSQPIDRNLRLVETTDLEGREPPDTLVIHADGRLSYRGAELADVDGFLGELGSSTLSQVRVLPDRYLEADRLVQVSRDLRTSGAGSVVIVTQRALS